LSLSEFKNPSTYGNLIYGATLIFMVLELGSLKNTKNILKDEYPTSTNDTVK